MRHLTTYTSKRKANIAVTGLTAAGKTTHSKMLEEEFGLSYVSASTMLRKLAGLQDDPPPGFWLTPEGRSLTTRIIELGVDEALRDEEDVRDRTVFDCRSLPWLTHNQILSVWLDSSVKSRCWKAMISDGRYATAYDEMCQEISQKDGRDRANLEKSFGFDIFTDRLPMDVVLDISHFITAPNAEAAEVSIRNVHDIISAIVGVYLTGEKHYSRRVRLLEARWGSQVFRGYSPRFESLLDTL